MTPRRLFVDMDGTIARFYDKEDCLERMWEPGFFKNLSAYTNVIKALKQLYIHNEIQIYILSSVPKQIAETAMKEKARWIKDYMPWLPEKRIYFSTIGNRKSDLVKKLLGELTTTDFLLDDYNANLREWQDAGGASVKLVNEINDKGTNGPLWNGERIRYDFEPQKVENEIERISGIALNTTKNHILENYAQEFDTDLEK